MFFTVLILFPLALLRPFSTKNTFVFFKTFEQICKYLLRIELEIEGQEIVYANRPGILIANHQHTFDILVVAAFFTPFLTTLGKIELFFLPLIGQYYWLSGNVLIKRNNSKKAMKSMDKVESHLRRKKLSVLIFPEGHRNSEVKLKKFKKGAFYTALKTQFPIIPISISQYGSKADWSGFKKVTIGLKVHNPIDVSAYNENNLDELIQISKDKIESGISELNKIYQ